MAHHATYSPSGGFPRAALCYGASTLINHLKALNVLQRKVNPAAEEGTKLHERIPESASLSDLEEEQASAVSQVRRFVASKSNGCDGLHHELPLVFEHEGREITFGTADVVIVYPSKVVVIDAKFGRAQPMPMFLNVQGAVYAKMAMEHFDVDCAEFYSLHPRLERGLCHCETFTDREQLTRTLLGILETAEKYPNTLTPGYQQCVYCPAFGWCEAAAKSGTQILGLPLDDSDAPPRVLASQLELARFVEKWVAARREVAKKCIENGMRVPGWGLQRRAGRRKGSPKRVLEYLKETGDDVSLETFLEKCDLKVTALEDWWARRRKELASTGAKMTLKQARLDFADHFAGIIERGDDTLSLVQMDESEEL